MVRKNNREDNDWYKHSFFRNWKNHDKVIRLLIKIASRGGNYLLIIGPDALGRVPKDSPDILDRVGNYVNYGKGLPELFCEENGLPVPPRYSSRMVETKVYSSADY